MILSKRKGYLFTVLFFALAIRLTIQCIETSSVLMGLGAYFLFGFGIVFLLGATRFMYKYSTEEGSLKADSTLYEMTILCAAFPPVTFYYWNVHRALMREMIEKNSRAPEQYRICKKEIEVAPTFVIVAYLNALATGKTNINASKED
ncbi:hypothetical protein LRP49_06845 [Enterovibrio sp. ZSDZ35]|uniref:Uncharacterized protein n=1 Tax=Enterovibrio qingdaonensis TaxID=2899818 RepID=A0ABT5QJT1_9GAMM|nr:hypothetical protein [Enterovibrio sp. ZSDZ35]MDD1780918.1 hypothetical protein [Enterovibrio sp. ZSDZ35]